MLNNGMSAQSRHVVHSARQALTERLHGYLTQESVVNTFYDALGLANPARIH